MKTFEPDYSAAIRAGRACVRLIEAVDVLLEQKPHQHELAVLKAARHVAVHQLRGLVADNAPGKGIEPMEGTLYDGDKVLAKGSYSLSSGSKTVTGSIAVGDAVGLLNFHFLTLRPKTGKDLEIVPGHIEHSPGEPPTLIFDVVP